MNESDERSFAGDVKHGLETLEQFVTNLSVVDWLLLGVAAALGFYLVASFRALTRLGPIEVVELETDDDKLQAKGLTAALREHLATAGLVSSPEVPAGAPQTDLLAAVEASPIPQANWLASIVRLIPRPRPPTYRLKGTLRSRDGSEACGVTYWLQETTGSSQTDVDTTWKPDYPAAIQAVASNVYVQITNSAVHVYPRWARWSSREAFDHYSEGLNHLLQSRGTLDRRRSYKAALKSHDKAALLEPRNLLPRIQIANVVEKLGALDDESSSAIEKRVAALTSYLDIIDEVPSLVEARYRASVLLSSLASEADKLTSEQNDTLDRSLPGPAPIDERLRNAANDQSAEALKWLGRFYTLRKAHRLRNRLEPTGVDRKRLKTTIRIARLCQRARRWQTPGSWWERRALWAKEWLWHLRVMLGRVGLGGRGTWQISYNAAGTYAVMFGRTARKRWRDQAFARLNDVTEDPLAELREDWLVKGDPDLASLRDLPEWHKVVKRYCRGPHAIALSAKARQGERAAATASRDAAVPGPPLAGK